MNLNPLERKACIIEGKDFRKLNFKLDKHGVDVASSSDDASDLDEDKQVNNGIKNN